MKQSLEFSLKEYSQPNGVKPEMRGRKLRSGEYWQGALKQRNVKRFNVKITAVCIIQGPKLYEF